MHKFWLGLILLLNSAISYAATGCIMIGQGEARVSVQGKERVPPLRLSDCEGVKVMIGTVSACFLNISNERTCRTLVAGDSFDIAGLAARQGAGTGAFRATLVSLLKGDPQIKIGQTRKGDRLPGFPYEMALLPNGHLSIRLQSPKERGIISFQIARSGSSENTVIISPQDGSFLVPQGSLIRGEVYTWEAHSGDAVFGGSFRLASTEQAKQMRVAAESLEKNLALDDVNRRLLLAEIYFENGFAFDAADVISNIGKSPAKKSN